MEINSLEDFIKAMPKDLNSIKERARYLYLELGKRSYYDPEYKYFMFGEEESYMEYDYKLYSNPNIIICKTLSHQFIELLSKAKIKAELTYDGGHYSVGFYDEEGTYHVADITNDLKNIQFGCKTAYFGTKTISQEDLRKIDTKLGYISTQKSYSDDYWHVIRDILQNSKLSKKAQLDLALLNMQKFGDITKPGETEIFSIYHKFIRYCLPECSDIMFSSHKKGRYDKEKCIIELYPWKDTITYLLNPETRLFEEQKRKEETNKGMSENSGSLGEEER